MLILSKFFPKSFRKRELISDDFTGTVKTYPLILCLEFMLGRRREYLRNKWVLSIFDKVVSKNISKRIKDFSLVIGYENANAGVFRLANENNIDTILDLAQIDFREISRIQDKFLFGTNVNIHEHMWIQKYKAKALVNTDYCFVLSEFAAGSLVKNGWDTTRLKKVHLPVNTEIFTHKRAYSQGEKLKVIFVGTLTKRKGIQYLLSIFERLREDIELIIVGPDSDASMLLESYHDIKRIEYVNHIELNKILGSSDLFVFPSLLDSWAQTVVEAMAVGLPIIVSDNTGSSELIHNNGFVVKSGSIDELESAVRHYLQNPEQLEIHGRKSREIAERISYKNYQSEVLHFLQDLL